MPDQKHRTEPSVEQRMGIARAAPGGHLPGNIPDPAMVGGADADRAAGDRKNRAPTDAAGDSPGTAGAGRADRPPPQR